VVPFVPEMLNTQEYLQLRREAFKNDGFTLNNTNAPDLLVWDTTRYTNWAKELMGSGKNTAVNAAVSGGDLRTNFRINAGYNKPGRPQQPVGRQQSWYQCGSV